MIEEESFSFVVCDMVTEWCLNCPMLVLTFEVYSNLEKVQLKATIPKVDYAALATRANDGQIELSKYYQDALLS